MSFNSPLETTITTQGFDKALSGIQADLKENLSWLKKSFHRAYEQSEKQGKRSVTVPKVWENEKEWLDVLPNDNWFSYTFFIATSEERILDYNPNENILLSRDVALIFWCDTSKIEGHNTGPSLALMKRELLTLLSARDEVLSIVSIVDEPAENIFSPFTIDDSKTHYNMLPYAGLRINFSVRYRYDLC